MDRPAGWMAAFDVVHTLSGEHAAGRLTNYITVFIREGPSLDTGGLYVLDLPWVRPVGIVCLPKALSSYSTGVLEQ